MRHHAHGGNFIPSHGTLVVTVTPREFKRLKRLLRHWGNNVTAASRDSDRSAATLYRVRHFRSFRAYSNFVNLCTYGLPQVYGLGGGHVVEKW